MQNASGRDHIFLQLLL